MLLFIRFNMRQQENNFFTTNAFRKILNDEMELLGNIPHSEKMMLINEKYNLSLEEHDETKTISPYDLDDIFLVRLTENLGITPRDIEIHTIIKNMEYCLKTLKMIRIKELSECLTYSDIIYLTNFLKLLHKYKNLEYFLSGVTIEKYNKRLELLGFLDKNTQLEI